MAQPSGPLPIYVTNGRGSTPQAAPGAPGDYLGRVSQPIQMDQGGYYLQVHGGSQAVSMAKSAEVAT